MPTEYHRPSRPGLLRNSIRATIVILFRLRACLNSFEALLQPYFLCGSHGMSARGHEELSIGISEDRFVALGFKIAVVPTEDRQTSGLVGRTMPERPRNDELGGVVDAVAQISFTASMLFEPF